MGKYYVHLNRNLICSSCGKTSQRWGKCWERGICANCFDGRVLTCRQCGAISKHINGKCWKQGICGLCARREATPKRYIPQYHMCPKCGERMMALALKKNGVYLNTGNYMCTFCSEIFILNTKYKVNHV